MKKQGYNLFGNTFLPYRNQSLNLQGVTIDWLLYNTSFFLFPILSFSWQLVTAKANP